MFSVKNMFTDNTRKRKKTRIFTVVTQLCCKHVKISQLQKSLSWKSFAYGDTTWESRGRRKRRRRKKFFDCWIPNTFRLVINIFFGKKIYRITLPSISLSFFFSESVSGGGVGSLENEQKVKTFPTSSLTELNVYFSWNFIMCNVHEEKNVF